MTLSLRSCRIRLSQVVPICLFAVVLARQMPRAGAQTAHFTFAMRATGGGFSSPGGLVMDGSGNLYVADTGNNAVKEIPAGCLTSTCVQALGGGFSSPRGVAVDPSGNVYVADTGNNAVKEIPTGCTSGACVTALGGGFSGPSGVAVDASGNVYVADSLNNAVEEMAAGCASSTCVTTLGSGFSNPKGIAATGPTFVIVADTGNNALKVTSVGCASSSCVYTFGGGFSSPGEVTMVGCCTIYVADTGTNAVKKVSTNCYSSACVAIVRGGLAGLQAVAPDTDGVLYITETGRNIVYEVMTQGVNFLSVPVGSNSAPVTLNFQFSSGGTILGPWVLTQAAIGLDFAYAGSGTCASNGPTYVYSQGSSCTVKVIFSPKYAGARYGAVQLRNSSGAPIGTAFVYGVGTGPQVVFSPASPVTVFEGLSQPSSVTVDGNDNIYVTEYGYYYPLGSRGSVREIPAGCTSSVCATALPGAGSFPHLGGVAVDGAGNVYVATSGTKAVKKIPAGCESSTCVSSAGFGFTNPSDVAIDGSGNVYVGDTGVGGWNPFPAEVWVFPPGCQGYNCTGGVWTENGNPPIYLALDANRDLFAAYGASQVEEIILTHCPVNCYSSVGGGFSGVSAIATDGSAVYVADSSGLHAMAAGCTSSSCVTTLNSAGITSSPGIALDSAGNIFVVDPTGGRLIEIPQATPPNLNFAQAPVGSESSDSPQMVSITNIGYGELLIPPPASGTNPSLPAGFALDPLTTCPEVGVSSESGSLAQGASCAYAVDFIPPAAGANSGALVLTDNAINADGTGYVTQSVPLSGYGYTPPSMTSPSSVLTGSSATFSWTAGAGLTGYYQLLVGTTGAGSSDVYNGSVTTNTSVTLSNIPTYGVWLYARLLYQVGNVPTNWQYIDIVYTQAGAPAPPALTAPKPGSTLTGSTVTFMWTSTGARSYQLQVGDLYVGSSDLYNGGPNTSTSVTVSHIPTVGAKLYVRLSYEINNTWNHIDYTFTEK